MVVYMYNDDCEPINDKVIRERFLLEEEAERIRAFIQDVYRELDIEVGGIENALDVAVEMLKKRRECDPENAVLVCRYLNRAASIGWDVHWHAAYIRKYSLPIDLSEYLAI